jgi:hypothetical protein
MRRFLHCALVAGALVVLNVASAVAQVDRATLSGLITDSNGGVLPGATVVVTSLATEQETRQQTTEAGGYQITNLIPGRYRVEVELSGFKKKSQVVTVEVGQRARLDVELDVGDFSETVNVVETPQLLRSSDATLGAVIPQSQVANLPLSIRNWDDLLALVPGVQGDRYTDQGGGTSFGRTGGINVHGARALQNNFLLDGVDNNSISENVQELTSQVSRPSVDAIQEFKVVTARILPNTDDRRAPPSASRRSQGQTPFTARATSIFRTRTSTPTTTSRSRPEPPSRPTTRTSSAAISAARSPRTRRSSSPTTKEHGSTGVRCG